jgi:hypothetical protein
MEQWSNGAMEQWSNGVLEYWGFGGCPKICVWVTT